VRARARLGWNCSVAKPSPASPSTVPSLRETWLTSAASPGSTAKPWFCAVTSTPARAGHADGVVGAAVAERELEGLQAEREPDELVAEARSRRCGPARGSSRTVLHDRAVELRRVAGAVAEQHRRRGELEHGIGVQVPGRRPPRLPVSTEAAGRSSACSRGRALTDATGPAPTVNGSRSSQARARVGVEASSGLREHARPVEGWGVGERVGVQLRRRGRAERAAHRTVSRRRPYERTRVDFSSATTPRCASQSRPAGRARRITTPSVQTSPDSSRPRRRRSCRRAGRRT
jgi:hypothetical protein